VLRFFYG